MASSTEKAIYNLGVKEIAPAEYAEPALPEGSQVSLLGTKCEGLPLVLGPALPLERNKSVQQYAMELEPIREILAQHGRLSQDARKLDPASCLQDAGLTSLATVSVMLALEDQFNIEFPDSMLSRRTFESMESIAEAVSKLVG